jgi:hypothetical protein
VEFREEDVFVTEAPLNDVFENDVTEHGNGITRY